MTRFDELWGDGTLPPIPTQAPDFDALWDETPPKRGVLQRAGRFVDRGLSAVGQRLGTAAAGVVEGLGVAARANPVGTAAMGLDPSGRGASGAAERVRDLVRGERERLGAPETGLETAADIGGAIFGEGVQFLAPGAALSKVPKVAALPRAGRIGAGLAADVPVDVAIGAGDADTSTAAVAGDLLDNDALRAIAEDPVKRAAFEAAAGLAAGTLLTLAGTGVRAGARKARQAVDVTSTIDDALDNAFGPEALDEFDIDAAVPRRIYEPPDRMSSAGAALRRAQQEAEAAEAAALARGRSLEGAPPPADPRAVRGTPSDTETGMLVRPGESQPGPLIQPAGYRPISPRVREATPTEVREFAPEPPVRRERDPADLRLSGSRPGIGSPALTAALARAGTGAAIGAPVGATAADEENKLGGALAGAAIGAGGPGLVRGAIRGRPRAGAIRNPFAHEYARAATDIDGLRVGERVDNMDSIEATLNDFEVLPGVRTIPVSDFDVSAPRDLFYALNDIQRTERLAQTIAKNNRIDPLIVVQDSKGIYILEGAHRLGALSLLGKKELPAIVVRDLEDLPDDLVQGSRPGFAETATAKGLARAGTGAALGAPAGAVAAGDEHKLGGALGGAALGAGLALAPAAARAARRPAGAPAAYLNDPAVQAVLGTVSRGTQKPGILTRLSKAGDVTGTAARKLYTRIVDDVQPLRTFGRTVGGTERLSQTLSQAKGHRGGATQRLDTEFRRVVGAAKGNEHGVTALAKAERALELARNGLDEKGVDLAAAQAVVSRLSAVPEVRTAVDALRTYYRNLLDFKLANGVLTRESYDAIISKGEFYVPFVRDFGAEPVPPSAGGGRLVNRGAGVRRMSEGRATAQTVDPFEQAILDTFEAHRTVAKQRVSNVVAGIVERNPEAASPFLRRIADPKAAKLGRSVQANINGKRQTYEVLDQELYDAWASFDNRTQNIFVRALQPFKRTLQAGVTLLPDFAAANAMRDNVQSAIQYGFPWKQSVGGAAVGGTIGAATSEDRLRGAAIGAGLGLGGGAMVPQIARSLRAMRDIIGNEKVYREWLREGGSGFSEFYGRPEEARKLIREFLGKRSILDTIMRPVDGLRALGRLAEEAPRLARFKAMRAQGADVTEAIAASRDISLDFATIGKDTKGLASTTAFLNAKVQGWDKLARMLRNPKTWATGAATITAPTIALWAVNSQDQEYWARPQWERNLFWLIPRPEGGFFRVPKPFEIGFIFASLPERLLDFAYQHDPDNLKHALGDMLATTGEGTLPVPTAIEPVLENVTNFDMFTRRPVVSMGLERLPNELQYDNRTSSLAVGAGRLTGMSPQKIENVIRGIGGSAAGEVLRGTSALARATGLDTRPQPPEGRAPLVGRFVTRDDQTSDQEVALRRKIERVDKAYAGARELFERAQQSGDMRAFERFIDQNADVLAERESLAAQKKIIDSATKARRQVYDAKIPAEEKREILTEINSVLADLLSPKRAAEARSTTSGGPR